MRNKHITKTGASRDRSRNRRDGSRRSNGLVPSKDQRRPFVRLENRQKFWDEVLSKSPRGSRYKRPGSMKARTN